MLDQHEIEALCTYLNAMHADRAVEKHFRFKFEFEGIYMLLIKGKMGILRF